MTQRSDTFAPLTQADAPGLRSQTASELFAAMPQMTEDLLTAPLKSQHSMDFLRMLRIGTTPEEALTFMAYALLPRHAVWWGHECLKATPDLMTDQDTAMLELIAAWVAEPDEDHRYAALNAAMAARSRSPGVWLALGAGWSGGSMSEPGLPEVVPPLFLMGRAINAGILSALARVSQDKRRRVLDHYISIGEVLARSS